MHLYDLQVTVEKPKSGDSVIYLFQDAYGNEAQIMISPMQIDSVVQLLKAAKEQIENL